MAGSCCGCVGQPDLIHCCSFSISWNYRLLVSVEHIRYYTMRCCACVTINADEVTNQQLRVNQILLNVLDSSYCIALFAFRLLLPSSHAILSLAACNNHTGRRAVNENSREFPLYSEKTLKTFPLTALTSIILCFPPPCSRAAPPGCRDAAPSAPSVFWSPCPAGSEISPSFSLLWLLLQQHFRGPENRKISKQFLFNQRNRRK